MRSSLLAVAAFTVLALSNCSVLAQQADPSSGPSGVVQQLNQLNKENLALILIFGTGFVAALLWGLGHVVSALRGDAGDAGAMRAQLEVLESRVAALEQAHDAAAARNEPAGVR